MIFPFWTCDLRGQTLFPDKSIVLEGLDFAGSHFWIQIGGAFSCENVLGCVVL